MDHFWSYRRLDRFSGYGNQRRFGNGHHLRHRGSGAGRLADELYWQKRGFRFQSV